MKEELGHKKLPKKHYEAKSKLNMLGLNYDKIHAFKDEYILFKEGDVVCKACNTNRYKDEEKTIHWKVLWHFLLIDTLAFQDV
jgi:hypothetical protein